MFVPNPKKMKSKIQLLVYLLLPLLLGFNLAHGAGLVGCTNDCTLGQLKDVVIRVVNLLFSLSAFIAMIFIVWAGYSMVAAAGNEEKLASAKESLSNAIIGFFLILVAYVLLDAILVILGGYHLTDYLNFIKG
jgi:small-conductance mechanosensitive channel